MLVLSRCSTLDSTFRFHHDTIGTHCSFALRHITISCNNNPTTSSVIERKDPRILPKIEVRSLNLMRELHVRRRWYAQGVLFFCLRSALSNTIMERAMPMVKPLQMHCMICSFSRLWGSCIARISPCKTT